MSFSNFPDVLWRSESTLFFHYSNILRFCQMTSNHLLSLASHEEIWEDNQWLHRRDQNIIGFSNCKCCDDESKIKVSCPKSQSGKPQLYDSLIFFGPFVGAIMNSMEQKNSSFYSVRQEQRRLSGREKGQKCRKWLHKRNISQWDKIN